MRNLVTKEKVLWGLVESLTEYRERKKEDIEVSLKAETVLFRHLLERAKEDERIGN